MKWLAILLIVMCVGCGLADADEDFEIVDSDEFIANWVWEPTQTIRLDKDYYYGIDYIDEDEEYIYIHLDVKELEDK